jgi:hypothetical protein
VAQHAVDTRLYIQIHRHRIGKGSDTRLYIQIHRHRIGIHRHRIGKGSVRRARGMEKEDSRNTRQARCVRGGGGGEWEGGSFAISASSTRTNICI